MADYNTTTKVIITEVNDDSDQVAGSLAKTVNDYIQTLDKSSNTILWVETCMIDRTRLAYIIVHES